MAALLRSFHGLRSFKYPFRNTYAFISTSKKSKETSAYPPELIPKKLPPPPVTVEDFAETKPRNWVSYGYDYENYEEDRHTAKVVNFCVITILAVGGTFIFAYIPDVGNRDWAVREAYLLLHKREKLGLPLIDKNYIDPEKIVLPTDEELGDTEIIL